MKKKNKGSLIGVPVAGASSIKELRKRKFKSKPEQTGKVKTAGVESSGKKKNNNGKKKKFSLFGSYRSQSRAKKIGSKLKKTGSNTRLLKRTVRTRGRGPKLERISIVLRLI